MSYLLQFLLINHLVLQYNFGLSCGFLRYFVYFFQDSKAPPPLFKVLRPKFIVAGLCWGSGELEIDRNFSVGDFVKKLCFYFYFLCIDIDMLHSQNDTMNPPTPPPPFSNPRFSFNPINPNPNSSFFPLHPQSSLPPPPPPQLPPPPPQPQLQTPLPDLSNTLSLLSNFLDLSNLTLQSLSSLLPSTNATSLQTVSLPYSNLTRCPSNPQHLMPPESLFLHYLNCPTPLDVHSLIDSLQYPKTLKTEDQLIQENKFVQPLKDPRSELCFSLDDYVDFDSNFFYWDCPGVVSSLAEDSSNRIFSLPGVLSTECANFGGSSLQEGNGFGKSSVILLPSDLWVLRQEMAQWCDFPNTYSYSVLRALLCLKKIKDSDTLSWLIANSPRFGIVIDASLRDHIFVLVRICLKAIIREAYHWFESLFPGSMDVDGGKLNPKTLNFKCPVLAEVLIWLTSQMLILYGETNAKSLSIEIIKNFLSIASSNTSWIPLDSMAETCSKEQDSVSSDVNGLKGRLPGKNIEYEEDHRSGQGFVSRPVYVYQVAAAITALHERSLLEQRIRALRNPPTLTPYQRVVEYSGFSVKADQERQNHPHYRPVHEHDGLPSMRSHSQDASNKFKTREELLAEERDYKRRRMSYRGKKLKRTPKEVLRDIIEEYTEAIRQAGGIGSSTMGVEVSGLSTSKTLPAQNSTADAGLESTYNENRMGRDPLDGYEKYWTSDNFDGHERRVRESSDQDEHRVQGRINRDSSQSYYQSRRAIRERSPGRYRSQSHRMKRGPGVAEVTEEKHYHSRNSTRSGNLDRSSGRGHRREEYVVAEVTEDKHYNSNYLSSSTSKYHDQRSSSRSSLSNISSGRDDKQKLETSGKHRRRRYEDNPSEDGFEDRYIPIESPDVCDDAYFYDSKHLK